MDEILKKDLIEYITYSDLIINEYNNNFYNNIKDNIYLIASLFIVLIFIIINIYNQYSNKKTKNSI